MNIISKGAFPDLMYNCSVCASVYVATSEEYDIANKTCACPVCGTVNGSGKPYTAPVEEETAPEATPAQLHILVTGEIPSGASAVIEDERINDSMMVLEWFVSDPDAIGSDWAIDTEEGQLTVTGDIVNDCWVALHLMGDDTTDDAEEE